MTSVWFLLAASVAAAAAPHSLRVEIRPRFGDAPLIFDALTNTTASGQTISVTRLDFLLSSFAFRRVDGKWVTVSDQFAFINGREGRTEFTLSALPDGDYDRLRFHVGVPERENHADTGSLAADHPLNPNLNGLHWSWQGGYVFMAAEGNWSGQKRGFPGAAPDEDRTLKWPERRGPATATGYSFHIATDRMLMTVELPLALSFDGDRTLLLTLSADRIFSGKHTIVIADDTSSTHSRPDDELATRLRENIESAFSVGSVLPSEEAGLAARANVPGQGKPLIASNATPYRFSFSSFFPQPLLPPDNPLTEEGVELGRRLFSEPRLSINNRQSCASCHRAEAAFTDGRRVSLGAEGLPGSRNAMPLFNLAWKSSFFWDGRAPSLREQVLSPIQNPVEMHETLTNVVMKLGIAGKLLAPAATNQDYPRLFAAAFGTSEITVDRLARALEQFLLAQISRNSKFDRSLSGAAEFTAEERRGFELFHTEYDPRRGQFGADCFHCHGGPLFQSQSFANNGLDAVFQDPGRFGVTGREGDRGKFAVPSLRNVALTAPYMHDGRFATLEQVVEHYATGVKHSATLDPNLGKHPDGGVPLSAEDKRALVAFLMTLTDERWIAHGDGFARAP